VEVILLDKVGSLGLLGDVVRVKPGYARNYLIPQGIAVRASKNNREAFEVRRAELELLQAGRLGEAQKRADTLAGLSLDVMVKAGDEGKLFGSVGAQDIADIAAAAGHAITRTEIRLADGPIRQTGEYEVEVRVHSDVVCTVTVNVIAD
jgi:large subunit ribosomal protein L9